MIIFHGGTMILGRGMIIFRFRMMIPGWELINFRRGIIILRQKTTNLGYLLLLSERPERLLSPALSSTPRGGEGVVRSSARPPSPFVLTM